MDERPPGTPAPAIVRLEGVTLASAAGASGMTIERFTVRAGEVVGVVHPTSFDRNELRRALLGLTPVPRGRVELLGRELSSYRPAEFEAARSRVGWVRDPPLFLNNVPLFENVILPLRFHTRLPSESLQQRGARLLARFGIDNLPVGIPLTYSYNRRRVASLARALLPEVDLLVIENAERTFLERGYRSTFLVMIEEIVARGTAVILTTTPGGRIPQICQSFLLVTEDGQTAQGDLPTLSRHANQRIREIVDRRTVWLLGREGTLG